MAQSSASFIDTTAYTPMATPEVSLRQIWHLVALPAELRLALAGAGVVQLDLFANLGQNVEQFMAQVKKLIDVKIIGEGPAEVMNETRLASAWKKASNMQLSNDSMRNDLTRNPTTIPEIPMALYNDYRAKFCAQHPDFILLEYKEPHKKFLERLTRDLIVHEVVPAYPPRGNPASQRDHIGEEGLFDDGGALAGHLA